MASCERCWAEASRRGIEYMEQLRRAEQNHEPCIGPSIEAQRLRAGQYWDEERQIDTRHVQGRSV